MFSKPSPTTTDPTNPISPVLETTPEEDEPSEHEKPSDSQREEPSAPLSGSGTTVEELVPVEKVQTPLKSSQDGLAKSMKDSPGSRVGSKESPALPQNITTTPESTRVNTEDSPGSRVRSKNAPALPKVNTGDSFSPPKGKDAGTGGRTSSKGITPQDGVVKSASPSSSKELMKNSPSLKVKPKDSSKTKSSSKQLLKALTSSDTPPRKLPPDPVSSAARQQAWGEGCVGSEVKGQTPPKKGVVSDVMMVEDIEVNVSEEPSPVECGSSSDKIEELGEEVFSTPTAAAPAKVSVHAGLVLFESIWVG